MVGRTSFHSASCCSNSSRGRPPFTADNLSALLFSIAHHPHPDIQTLRPDLPPMVQEIVDRALQKELPHRYRRAEEFARELRACLQSLAA